MADPKAKDAPNLLEEDDEFEEFQTEEWTAKEASADEAQQWDDNWDDDNVEDDFSKQLKAELEKAQGRA